MKKTKILYHGSNKRINILLPRKPSLDLPENSMKAVFATDNRNFALAMGLTYNKNTSSFKGYKKINFVKGKPKMKAVYLHLLRSDSFLKNREGEYISKVPVKPILIKKYSVSELGHLWRKSSKEELREFLKDRVEWRRNNKDK